MLAMRGEMTMEYAIVEVSAYGLSSVGPFALGPVDATRASRRR